MFGNYSYLFLTIILTTPIIIIEWVFFYNILKQNIYSIIFTTIVGLLILSFSEPLGVYLQAWRFGTDTTLPALLLGVKFESYLYVILGSISVSSLVVIYTTYEDMKINNIFWQGVKDLISLKYAFWKKELL